MNITCIPYHDWRKITKEGSRTRDSHFIHHLVASSAVSKVLVVNRPSTFTEILLKKKGFRIYGKLLLKRGSCSLYKINEKLFVLDYISKDHLGPIINGKKWFFDSFDDPQLLGFYEQSLEFLNFTNVKILSQNVFSASFVNHYISVPTIFDAWDNFLLFPENQKIKQTFIDAYRSFANSANMWVTNSEKNVEFYNENYKPSQCVLIKNGVDLDVFSRKYDVPEDLKGINRPIIGFGGKITHLFDYELFNYVTEQHSDKNFVIVGQILDKHVFKKIMKRPNVHYLGDKNYDLYKKYVTNFDVGIIPYVTNQLEHGADSIKVYEYVASGLNVVGTLGAGMEALSQFIFLSKDKEHFSSNLLAALSNDKKVDLPVYHTWSSKTADVIRLLESFG